MQWNIIGLLYKKVTTLARCLIAMTLITMCRASVTSTWLDKTSTFQQVRAHIFICDTTQMCPIHLRYVNVDPSNTNKSGLKLHLLPCSIRHRSKPFYRSSSHLDVFTLQLFISHHLSLIHI